MPFSPSEGRAARVRCVVEFSGEARKAIGFRGLLPPSAVYRFDLDVAEEGGSWKVRGATWERAETPCAAVEEYREKGCEGPPGVARDA